VTPTTSETLHNTKEKGDHLWSPFSLCRHPVQYHVATGLIAERGFKRIIRAGGV
jgi:hypothetical protein